MPLPFGLSELNWRDWIRSLLSAGISAAASTIAANPIAQILGANQFTPRQLGVMAVSSAVVAMAAVLRKSPLPDRKVAIALLAGVHTEAEVNKIVEATAPGTVPTQAVAAAILGKPAKAEAPAPEAPTGGTP